MLPSYIPTLLSICGDITVSVTEIFIALINFGTFARTLARCCRRTLGGTQRSIGRLFAENFRPLLISYEKAQQDGAGNPYDPRSQVLEIVGWLESLVRGA
jgi:hypothetical protein